MRAHDPVRGQQAAFQANAGDSASRDRQSPDLRSRPDLDTWFGHGRLP